VGCGAKATVVRRSDSSAAIASEFRWTRAPRSVLRFGQFDRPAIQMHLRPRAGVLLTQAHPCVDAHNEFGQVLREAFRDDFVQLVVFLPAEKPQPPCTFLPLTHKPSRID